jgi:hypothetical protein
VAVMLVGSTADRVSAVDVLLDLSPVAQGWRIAELLSSQRQWGRRKSIKLLDRQIIETKLVGASPSPSASSSPTRSHPPPTATPTLRLHDTHHTAGGATVKCCGFGNEE